VIFYKQFDLSLANLPKGIPFSPAFALNTLTFCNGTDRRWCSAIISTFPPDLRYTLLYICILPVLCAKSGIFFDFRK